MKIGLGTVQFGQNYGVSNKHGITPEGEVRDVLTFAWENGITLLDTAVLYGASEEVVGRSIPSHASFTIVTKTPTFQNTKIEKEDAVRLKDAFQGSLDKLRQPNLYGLLVHHAIDLLKDGGQYLWEGMQDLKEMGLVQKIGASLYSPLELNYFLEKYAPDIVQMPVNVFDQRMVQNGYLQHLNSLGVEIHSRSVFLQGLLLMTPGEMPTYFNSVRDVMLRYREALQKQDINPLEAALMFVYRQPEIDYVIVGINNQAHLKEILNVANNIDLLRRFNFSIYAVNEEAIINPSLWRLQ
ncbi:MAG: aryl-alcohol dehydrogenase [Syntrophus sp. (in: bacteria)]|nr:aryl-alcohol dehydrogenase [Syntrophus sp. (in: bacteria)]